MPEIRHQFINSSIENLELLHRRISSAKEFPASFVREIFRQIHTVKGTAQTFGFNGSARIAHELESILSDVQNERNTLTKELLLESITALKRSFIEYKPENAEDLIEKIKNAVVVKKYFANIFPELPVSIFNSLSKTEIETLSAAFANRKHIFCLEIYFALKNFRESLLRFREVLEQNGEIIATLSAEKKDLHIGFRFLFAGKNLEATGKEFAPLIIFEISPIKDNLLQVLRETTAHGKNLAKQLGKKIEFEIFVGEISPSDIQIKIIFDALLHIIRNAVSHAIEIPSERIEKEKPETGKIEICITCKNNNLNINISDDGKGIDAEKVKSRAVEKNLISKKENLSEQEMLNLIFLSGISTAENLTEVSGRGVGLDSVKREIEDADGTIKVRNREKFGTKFEIVFPPERGRLVRESEQSG